MTIRKYILMVFLVTATLIANFLSADESTNKEKDTQRVGGRARSQAEKTQIQEMLAKESGAKGLSNIPAKGLAKSAKPLFYYTSHPGALHQVIALWQFLDKIELQDGTIWQVAGGDQWKVADWLITDVIIILPNHSLFSIYDYVLYNQRTGDYVLVNLYEIEVNGDPTFFGQRHWVIAFDDVAHLIYLEDGSIWNISSTENYIVDRWEIGDIVVLGVNDGSGASKRPNILINVETLDYVRATCVY